MSDIYLEYRMDKIEWQMEEDRGMRKIMNHGSEEEKKAFFLSEKFLIQPPSLSDKLTLKLMMMKPY